MDLSNVPLPSEDYCVRELEEETIFLSLKGDRIHTMDGTGTFFWHAMDGTRSLARILDRICETYEVERSVAEADLLRFTADLVERGLVTFKDG